MKKILFISHDATLTGAPVLLLNLIKLLQKGKRFEIRVIIKNGFGNLLSDFKKIAQTEIWKQHGKQTAAKKITAKILKPLTTGFPNDKKIQNWINESDIIVSNTITNGDFFAAFNFSGSSKIVTYVHELEFAVKYFTNETALQKTLDITGIFAVPSNAVASYLVNQLKVPSNHIHKLDYYIPFERGHPALSKEKKDIFIAGIAGTLDWRKGADIISVIVINFFSNHPGAEFKFLWKGVDKLSIEYKRIEYELQKAGLSNKVIFEEPSKNLDEFYSKIDVLLLCSKEDPYPLVVLEAASFSKPCICFENAGGAPEFVQDDAGTTIPYLNINKITTAIYSYYSDKDIVAEKGNIAFKRYHDKHLNEALIQSQFEAIAK